MLLSALTVIMTWPQALHLATAIPNHDDPLFSIWRLGWIAHALATDPAHLFDANIFYPHLRTLAYSDAMLFEGLIAAPLLWAQLNPVLVYNLMFFAAIISSGRRHVRARSLSDRRYPRGAGVGGRVHPGALPHRTPHPPRAAMDGVDAADVMGAPPYLRRRRAFDLGATSTGLFLWLQIVSASTTARSSA